MEDDEGGKDNALIQKDVAVAPNNRYRLVKPGEPAGPASGGTSSAKRYVNNSASKFDKRSNSFATLTQGVQPLLGKASQINMTRRASAERMDEATTVSYNTKIFNREISALRSEEEALLKQKNETRLREFKVGALKKRPAGTDMLIKDDDIVNVDISVDLGQNSHERE